MHKLKYIFILYLVLSLGSCDKLDISSDQANTFYKLYGSWKSDKGVDVKLFGSGYIVLATVTSTENDNTEIALLQTDKYGNILGEKIDTLSSLRGGNNTASKLLKTMDGGFVVLGTVSDTSNNNTEIFIQKFNSSAESEWEKFIGTSDNETGSAIRNASTGYIIAGSTDAEDVNGNNKGSLDIYLVKVDENGNVEWAENHGGAGNDYSNDIITIPNGYIVVGTTNGYHFLPGQANNNIFVVKTNLDGGSPDVITYGGTNNDYGASIAKVDDGGYLVIGSVEDLSGSNSDIYAVRSEEDIHSILWSKEFGLNNFNDNGYQVINSNGGYIIVGGKELSTGMAAYFLKIDNEGEEIIENTYGGYGQVIYAIEPTYDGGFIMTGSSGVEGSEMISLIKVNSDGEL